MNFTVEESNLMCIYNTGSRADLIAELTEMQTHLQSDETELKELAHSVIGKLQAMTDAEFIAVTDELIADFGETED
ncbi:MAG: transposon-transfer assisting family protein [Clostridia bacterium]|nr:transposon-transfer assisting family protein [Clostridia bacterium]